MISPEEHAVLVAARNWCRVYRAIEKGEAGMEEKGEAEKALAEAVERMGRQEITTIIERTDKILFLDEKGGDFPMPSALHSVDSVTAGNAWGKDDKPE